jgi:hypothetical protein
VWPILEGFLFPPLLQYASIMAQSENDFPIELHQLLEVQRFLRPYEQVTKQSIDENPLDEGDSGFVEDNTSSSDVDDGQSESARICLDLKTWKYQLEEEVEQQKKIERILQYFVAVAQKNGLKDTPAVSCLERAISTLAKNDDSAAGSWMDRISQRTILEVKEDLSALEQGDRYMQRLTGTSNEHDSQIMASQPLLSSRALYKTIPLFNLWDALSYIYTMCVEEIKSQLMAELHLFQFGMIIEILRNGEYFAAFASPTTVASAWADMGNNFLIAYATTCVGPKEEGDKTKEEMANVRCEFMTRLEAHREQLSCVMVVCRNRRGNCPEFLVWPMICHEPGSYSSLCFSTNSVSGRSKSLKFCGYCEQLANFLRKRKIEIEELWENALLCDEKSRTFARGRYPYRLLRSATQILDLVEDC